jgi:hypothetical protein
VHEKRGTGQHRNATVGLRVALGGSFLCCVGCFGGAQLILKGPISDRCSDAGLKGCESLTDGVLEYVDGDRDEAMKKIQKGAAQNEPEKLREFADRLRALKSIPGADQYIHPVLEVADLLSSDQQESKFSSAKTSGRAKTSMKREGSPRGGDDSASSAGGSERARAGTIVPSVDARAIACAPFGDTNITVDGPAP